jgi:hypothetical protein
MSGDAAGGVKACPRCGTASQHVAWCPKCGLNLRPHTPAHAPSESSHSVQADRPPPTAHSPVVQHPPDEPLRDLWERLLHSPSGPVVGIGALVAILVLAIVLLSGGGGGGHSTVAFPPGEAVANPTPTTSEPTQTEGASTTPTTSATTVESSQVETVLKEYEQDYSGKDLEALKGLFAESLTRKNGPSAPEEDLEQAIGTYEHQFSELKNPSYSLFELKVEPSSSEASASGRYSISSQTGTVTGSIDFHLVEQNEKLLIDKITVEPSK